MEANAMAIATAKSNHHMPVKPNSIEHTIARSPHTTPTGSPKYGPVPDLMEGIVASTSKPHIPKRPIVSEMRVGRGRPLIVPKISMKTQNAPMIKAGIGRRLVRRGKLNDFPMATTHL